MERRIQKHATRLVSEAALEAAFRVGQRVRTLDGFIGRILEVTQSFSPGIEQYQIVLDNGMGGGTYTASQLRPIPEDYGGLHQDPANLPAGVGRLVSIEDARNAWRTSPAALAGMTPQEYLRSETEIHTAMHDYPEMGRVLLDRPDPAAQITVIGAAGRGVYCEKCRRPAHGSPEQTGGPQFFHGSPYEARPGDIITPGGRPSLYDFAASSKYTFFSHSPRSAAKWAKGSMWKRAKNPRVYGVEPVGEFGDDPGSYQGFRSKHGLRVTHEIPFDHAQAMAGPHHDLTDHGPKYIGRDEDYERDANLMERQWYGREAAAYGTDQDPREPGDSGGIYWQAPAQQQWIDENLDEPEEPPPLPEPGEEEPPDGAEEPQEEPEEEEPAEGEDEDLPPHEAAWRWVATQMSGRPGTAEETIDGHGDAPDHGSNPGNPRAARPDSYDDESTEGDGDDKWSEAEALHGHGLDFSAEEQKKRNNGAQIGMYPEGMSNGGGSGPGLPIGSFVAYVPWTGEQRGDLHEWSTGSGANPGDFVPSSRYHVEKYVPEPEILPDSEDLRELGVTASYSAGEQGLCAYLHDGECPWPDDFSRTAESLRHPRPKGFVSSIRPLSDEEREWRVSRHNAATHVLEGTIGGHHVGDLHFIQSDDGRALRVTMLHTQRKSQGGAGEHKGIGSAMMDDLYKHAHEHGTWINHGMRSAEGLSWWNRYNEPYPEYNVHNVKPHEPMGESYHHPRGEPWSHYFSPSDVAADAWTNWHGDPEGRHRRPGFEPGHYGDDPHHERWTKAGLGHMSLDEEDEPVSHESWIGGVARLHPEDHEVVHDRAAPMHVRARTLLTGLNRADEYHAGNWTPESNRAARDVRRSSQMMGEGGHSGGRYTGFLVHAEPDENERHLVHSVSFMSGREGSPQQTHRFDYPMMAKIREGERTMEHTATSENQYWAHLQRHHYWSREDVERARSQGQTGGGVHWGLHDAGTADHLHNRMSDVERDRLERRRDFEQSFGQPFVVRRTHPQLGDSRERLPSDPYGSIMGSEEGRPQPLPEEGTMDARYRYSSLQAEALVQRRRADAVYGQLAKDYPHKAIDWVHSVRWHGPEQTALSDVNWAGRKKWASYDQPERVAKVGKKQQKRRDKGKDPKPAIMTQVTGGLKDVADGHHRTLDALLNGRPVDSMTAEVPDQKGPWAEMHAQQFVNPETGRERGPDGSPEERDEFHGAIEGAISRLPGDEEPDNDLEFGDQGPQAETEDEANSLESGEPGGMPGAPPVMTGLPPWTQGTNPPPGQQPAKPSRAFAPPGEDGKPDFSSGDPKDPADKKGDPKEKADKKPSKKESRLIREASVIAARDPAFQFEFTASWRDVVAKAKRIRSAMGVRITLISQGMVIGEVRGDHDVYESGIQRVAGKPRSIMYWACGCPWASFHQDKTVGTRYAGRPCSHVYALQLESVSRTMHGRELYQDPSLVEIGMPPRSVVVKSLPPWGPGGWNQTWLAPAASLRTAADDDSDEDEGTEGPEYEAGPVRYHLGHAIDWAQPGDIRGHIMRKHPMLPRRVLDENPDDRDLHAFHNKVHEIDSGTWQADHDHYAFGREFVPYGGREPEVHGYPDVMQGGFNQNRPLTDYDPPRRFHRYQDTDQIFDETKPWVPSQDDETYQHFHPNHLSMLIEADQANAPWGSQTEPSHPPAKPFGATEPRSPETNPASVGFLTAPDPENWGEIQDSSYVQQPLSNTASLMSWEDVGNRHPHVYGNEEDHGDEAEGADGEGIGWAAKHLAYDRPEDPDAENSDHWNMDFHHEWVNPKHIDYARHEHGDHRVQQAERGYREGGARVPPLVLVHRHGVYQVADGHHRAQGAVQAGHKLVPAYVHYSEHEDVPFSDGTRGPFHGAEPHPENRHLATMEGLDIGDWGPEYQESFPYSDQSNTAGPSTSITPQDPQGIRMDGAVRHSWQPLDAEGTSRGKRCASCGIIGRRYGHGSASYWGYHHEGHDEVFPSSVPSCGSDPCAPRPPVDVNEIFNRIERSSALRIALAYLADEAPQLLGGLGAELHDEPEGALDPQGLTADDVNQGGPSAGSEASLAAWGALLPERSGDLPQEPGYSLAPATTGGGPGMSMHDEDLTPWSDMSIQTIGQQQWSGAGADSDEMSVPAGMAQGDEYGGTSAQGKEDEVIARFQASRAGQSLSKTAEVFSDAEAGQLIAEGRGSRARNLDLLDIAGTHYEDNEEEMQHRGLSLDHFDDDLVLM